MPSQSEIRENIVSTIVDHLKAGNVAPWRRPWSLDKNAGAPANVVSKRNYRGINPLLLMVASMRHGFQSRHWGTWKQWKEMGGSVKRRPPNVKPGEWGTNIVFWRSVTKSEQDSSGEEKKTKYFILKTYTVFNVDQVEGDHLDHLRVGHGDISDEEVQERYEAADAAIEATGADIRHGGNEAAYHPVGDFITLPHRHQFNQSEYYETVCHELTHWTEHESRLNWDRSNPDHTYALGELVAELGGCFIASELGLPTAERLDNHASYLQHWLQKMQDDPKYLLTAAAQAAKAADFVLDFSRESVEEPEAAVA